MSASAKELRDTWRAHTASAGVQSHDSDARIGFAGSFTLDPLLPYLGAKLLGFGYRRPEFLNANFNQLLRVCRDPSSEFGDAKLGALVLLWRLEDLAEAGDPASVREVSDLFLNAVRGLREIFSGSIILALPPRPRPAVEGLVEFARPSALAELWYETLKSVSALAQSVPDLHTVDLEALIAACGESVALDHRKEMLYRQPYSDGFYVNLADALARIYRAQRFEPKKCIVLDCDNTLWGGVIGEDGVGGVSLSDDFPGRAYRLFQQQVAVLRQSGVFVALNTKNNPDDVWEMFDNHDAMVLRKEDISSSRINWRPKSENLKEIAAELNIGLDALVFVDDSPFEIEEVRAHAPEVTTILVPEDIADLPVLMMELAHQFDRLNITEADRARVDMMRQETVRRDLSQKMTEEEFLASLDLQVQLQPVTSRELARVTQLINKTNQFNVTTRRYTLEEVGQFVSAHDHDIYCITVKDRFGDYGLVGVGILKHVNGVAEFDTLLMSCRVLGRGIETAMISYAVYLARARGSKELRGRYIPTRKNAMVADLFTRHGFEASDATAMAAKGCDAAMGTQAYRRHTEPLPVPGFLTALIKIADESTPLTTLSLVAR